MKLSDPVEVPVWIPRVATPAASLFLLWCAVEFLNWFTVPVRQMTMYDQNPLRCFTNGQPFMPLAAIAHSVLCAGVYNGSYPDRVYDDVVRLSLYGGVFGVWLAARTLAGWWSAGIAALFMATSPFLFALDNQVSPASLGLFFGILTCWFAAEAFGRSKPGKLTLWHALWFTSALLAVGTFPYAVWIIVAQLIYAGVQRRAAAPKMVGLKVLIACAVAAIAAAFTPSTIMGAAVVRYDARAALENIFTFSFPDEWMSPPHMATYLSVSVLVVLIVGALVARSTALPYFLGAIAFQAFIASTFAAAAWSTLSSLASLVPIVAMTLGSTTAFLITRKPHMLAFVVPAFAIAAQFAAFERLPLQPYGAFDFDFADQAPVPAFVAGDRLRLYHDRGHAEYVTVFRSIDDIKHGNDTFRAPTMTRIMITGISPYRIERQVKYAYRASPENGSWHGLVNSESVWPDISPGACIRQPDDRVRLYGSPNVAFREEGHSRLEPPKTIFRVLHVNGSPYQPDLQVRIVEGKDAGREGWIYGQTLLLGTAADANKAAGFACSE